MRKIGHIELRTLPKVTQPGSGRVWIVLGGVASNFHFMLFLLAPFYAAPYTMIFFLKNKQVNRQTDSWYKIQNVRINL